MSKSNSYLDKTFVVTDPDARIRKPSDLMTSKSTPLPMSSRLESGLEVSSGYRKTRKSKLMT